MIALALAVGLGTLVVGVAAAWLLRLLPTVRLQLVGLALLAVALPLAAVSISGLVMFHMGADVAVLGVSAAAALAALVGALGLERAIARRLERIRDASTELAAGDLAARAPTGGPAELAELAASFNAMADNLERYFDARRQLVAWASHDLRAPVTSLKAMLEAIEDGVVEADHYLPALQGQVRLLGTLVEDLFELARIDAGVLSLDVEAVDLGALVERCLLQHEAAARRQQVSLALEVRDAQAVASCVPDKIERVMSNLLANALHATPAGGRIAASVTTGAGAVLVALEDTGVGIAPEALDQAFEPFWRQNPARTPSEGGAGLGLAIARGLIEAQGGRIWAERPTAGGTRICFVLPQAPAAATAAPGSRSEPAARGEPATPSGGAVSGHSAPGA